MDGTVWLPKPVRINFNKHIRQYIGNYLKTGN